MSASLLDPRAVAGALTDAARAELDLTPKPGLVDRRDNGSHPDLSYDLMSRSIDLLPRYFEELLEIAARSASGPRHGPTTLDHGPKPDLDLAACIAAGRRAEERMVAAIGSNAHRGYIFLAGLVLLAAAGSRNRLELRGAIADLSARILSRASDAEGRATHGALVRRRLSVGGIHAEALAGLPSVFDHGLPQLERAVAAFGHTPRAHHLLMASLMTVVEDTTALHRAGREGLARLRRDGSRLLALIESGSDYLPALAVLNEEYRAAGMTMGGVADCMAICLALAAPSEP